MFYIATAKGFVVYPGERQPYDFTPDSRYATPFEDFLEADKLAKECVEKCLPKRLHYFSILDTCNGDKTIDDNVIDVQMTEVKVSGVRKLIDTVRRIAQ
jgi:hypothetical protein